MQRSKSVLVLAAYTVALAGCELIVHFDDSRLDAGGDVPHATDVRDVQSMSDGGDVVTMDVPADGDAQPMLDVPADTDASPRVDVPPGVDGGTDAIDVAPTADAQPDVVAVDASDSALPLDVASDAGALLPVNGCTPATATDLSAMATPTINFPGTGFQYVPPCVSIHVGQSVTFAPTGTVTFADHPLTGGTTVAAVATPDPTSPIGMHATGSAPVVVTFAVAGTYGFYCSFHFATGMEGAVYVTP